MREIKVRAWDEVEKRFWTLRDGGETSGEGSVQYYGNEQGVLEIGRLEEFDVGDMWSSQFTVFPSNQFTGLKDKNGREIYEGDIVRYLDGCDTSTESGFDFDEYMNHGEVIFDEECVMYDVTRKESVCREDLFGCEELEVIGNIYENAELLEVEE